MSDGNSEKFLHVFQKLKPILSRYTDDLVTVHQGQDKFYLDTHHIMPNKKPLFFGSVSIKKNYVSFHLMPVYVSPELLKNMSPELGKRMQGKSCFNFTTIDEPLTQELSELVAKGFKQYQSLGYIKVD